MLHILEFIKSHDNWKELLTQDPYNLKITEDGPYVILKYNQINSDFSLPLVKECRGIILKKPDFKVVCQAFNKFMNAGEPNSDLDKIDWSTASVQEKIDGCLDENDLLVTNYGVTPIKTVVESKRQYKVLTYNHETHQNEFQYIDAVSIKENDGRDWYEIETDYGKLRLTGNHQVFCVNEGRYKRVDELTGDEELQLLEPGDYLRLANNKNRIFLFE